MIQCFMIPLEKAIVFQVLEQDEAQRGTYANPKQFEASNGMVIKSQDYPRLTENAVYVQGGYRKHDHAPKLLRFGSNNERDRYLIKVRGAMQEWASRGGFSVKPRPKPAAGTASHFYSF